MLAEERQLIIVTMCDTIFINYRRDDCGAEAKLIADRLSQRLSSDAVFMDTHSISVGDRWPNRIRTALASSKYVVVVIGPNWLHAGMDEWGLRRIDDESDWVRNEIVLALQDESKTVIPVLINNAKMPPASVLPREVAPIVSKQAISLRRDFWEHDIELLTTRLASCGGIASMANVNPLLRPIWPHIDDELRQILVLAATLAQFDGKNYVSTTNFVKALMVLRPGRISEFFDKLPDGALPEPVPTDVPMQLEALASLESFSPCINSAMSNLTTEVSTDDRLSSEDVYIDIARHGTGKSTRQLRNCGVGRADVERIINQLGWQLVERRSTRTTQ